MYLRMHFEWPEKCPVSVRYPEIFSPFFERIFKMTLGDQKQSHTGDFWVYIGPYRVRKKSSLTGNRTRAAGVRIRNPNP